MRSKQDWVSSRLGDICSKIGSGATPRGGKEVYLNDGTFTLIRSQNIYNNSFSFDGLVYISEQHAANLKNVEVTTDDVLLNITGDSVARSCQVPKEILPARVNQHVAIIRPDPSKLSSHFLRYVLVSPEIQSMLLSWAGSGGTRNALTKDMIESIIVHAPAHIGEQQAIANILGTLDNKIEVNQRINETLEDIARALFKSWFIDFDPVRAKMEGRDTSLPEHIADLFPDRMVDSELGKIPEGWKVQALNECFNLTMGQSPPSSTYNELGDGLPFFQGRTDFGFRYPDIRKFCSVPNRIANPGDTLVSVRAPVGDINMALEQYCIGRGIAALRHKLNSSSFTYYSAWRLQKEIREYEHTGTVFGAITKKQFEMLHTIEPTPELIIAFDAFVTPIDALIRKNTYESRTLTSLRNTLLPKLVSGELRIRTHEDHLISNEVEGCRF